MVTTGHRAPEKVIQTLNITYSLELLEKQLATRLVGLPADARWGPRMRMTQR